MLAATRCVVQGCRIVHFQYHPPERPVGGFLLLVQTVTIFVTGWCVYAGHIYVSKGLLAFRLTFRNC